MHNSLMEKLRKENGIFSFVLASLLILLLDQGFVGLDLYHKLRSSPDPYGVQHDATIQHMTKFTSSVGQAKKALDAALNHLFRDVVGGGERNHLGGTPIWQSKNGRQRISNQ